MKLPRLLRAAGRLPHGRDVHEAVARSVSRLAAGDDFPNDETRAGKFLDELLRCDLPYASPSGRPTMIQFSLPNWIANSVAPLE